VAALPFKKDRRLIELRKLRMVTLLIMRHQLGDINSKSPPDTGRKEKRQIWQEIRVGMAECRAYGAPILSRLIPTPSGVG